MHTTFVALQKAQSGTQIGSLGGLIHTDGSRLSLAVVFDRWGMSLFMTVLLILCDASPVADVCACVLCIFSSLR